MDRNKKTHCNLFCGWPNPSLHPTADLNSASSRVLSDPALSTPALNYGPDEGDPELRAQIAAWLTEFYHPSSGDDGAAVVTPDRVVITGGASQNLACVLQVFADQQTRYIWMVSPTYYLACPIFDDAGFAGRLRAVREDEEGLDIAQLEEGLKRAEEEPQSVR
jgi:DNA-binding transcriptional MocR family regulator